VLTTGEGYTIMSGRYRKKKHRSHKGKNGISRGCHHVRRERKKREETHSCKGEATGRAITGNFLDHAY